MSFIWLIPILLRTVYQWYEVTDSLVFIIPAAHKTAGEMKYTSAPHTDVRIKSIEKSTYNLWSWCSLFTLLCFLLNDLQLFCVTLWLFFCQLLSLVVLDLYDHVRNHVYISLKSVYATDSFVAILHVFVVLHLFVVVVCLCCFVCLWMISLCIYTHRPLY